MRLLISTLNHYCTTRRSPFFSPSQNPRRLSPLPQLPALRVSLKHHKPSSARCGTTMACSEASPPRVQVKDQIDLTDKEKQIFDRLLQVVRHFGLQTQLRVAGGWVRDKLLGKECYDIDIALDNKLGTEFCEKVNEYLSSIGEETQGIGVIERNPDQSKHLETARMRLCDIWIDFVNLRAEDYCENSRIPTMKFGTAKEDAYRRDLTINSLFYNINLSSIEDFTGKGIMDLKCGRIVTPLPPKQTFLDDPLRVLRAIRFGARFDFMLDEELKKAASDDDVKAAIADKISRERIGHEINLMISGNQPLKAITYVADLHLFWTVFSLPLEFEPPIPENCDKMCVAYMDQACRILHLTRCLLTDDQRRLCLYAALFLPFRDTIYRGNKAKKIPVVSYILKNSLKLKSSDSETVISLHIAAKKFASLIPYIKSEDTEIIEVDWKKETIDVPVALKRRILTGLVLRDIKDFWRVSLALSVLLYPTNMDLDEVCELEKRSELFKTVEKAILNLGLEKVWELKPLVNGKEIMNVLEINTGGRIVNEWQQKLLEWQLSHPCGTAEECIDWMREAKSKRIRME
ncbi:unnamed protein product [Cuscuta campestris]|uniref:Poly A polymerase head domain-containing protein n=1 Tax=Cuscuta campestris TaxID=132261 RepID=A0A484NIN7_9ASTE|nr:unnamed protein product [Cuscuta campestris]